MTFRNFQTRSSLSKLIGWTVVGVATDGEEHEPCYALVLERGEKQLVMWILRDDEGNGPGSFSIEDLS